MKKNSPRSPRLSQDGYPFSDYINQNQNGLRVNDYRRYAHFCKKKINKLRKFFKLTQGKKKYQKVEITADKIVDNKILLIAILECERNWSYGMFHKQELTAIGEDIKRLRHQI